MPRSSLARKPLPKPSPDSDPRYQRVMTQVQQGAACMRVHPPAARKAADAAKAAKGPPTERIAAGKAKQVDRIKEAKEGKPEQSAFLAVLRAEIAKVMPKTLGETENFDQTAQQVKGGLKENVSRQTESSARDLSGASKAAPAPAGETKAGQPLPTEGLPVAPRVDAAEGMPVPKSDADVSLQDSRQSLDEQLKAAEITPQQLEKGKSDSRYAAVQSARAKVARSADAGPGKYRPAEKGILAASAAMAASAARAGAAALVGVRGTSNARVLSRQQQQKADDEKKREEVVGKIEKIYTGTKERVDKKLEALDGEVDGIFDRGVDAAVTAMTKFVATRIRDYKFRRYLNNPLLWVRDGLLGLPEEVSRYTEQGRTLFHSLMDVLIGRVANLVEQRLREAKAEVAKGQAEIKTLVSSQPKELQQVARQAQADVTSRFAELERGIDEKKDSLALSLAQKYQDAFAKANDALKQQQDENKSLYDQAREKVEELANAVLEFKARLTAILRKGADTIKLIVDDPIGFLGNLINAVKGGFQAFAGNIKTHLQQGFLAWLFGNMPPGVAPPADLSLPSIFKLVLGVLGITYDRMRAKAVKLIGERNVKIIEKVADYIQTLITGGARALWEKVEQDLSDLKAMVIDAIQDYLVKTVIEKAVAKIVMMFNPAGAIVQAILTIYNVVMFVVEKAAQIAAFVESVVNSIHVIATGSIGAAMAKVEQSLARTIPIVIGFLASLASLGKLSAKVREFILKVQAKVDAAIDKAIAKIVAVIKKTIGKLMGKDKKDKRTDREKKQELARAKAEAERLQQQPHVTLERVRAGLPAIKQRYNLTTIALVSAGRDKYHIRLVINPDDNTTDKDYEAKFKLLPGKIPSHEGIVILEGTADSAPVVVHLITRHGPKVAKPALLGRISKLKALYRAERKKRRTEKLAEIEGFERKIHEEEKRGAKNAVTRIYNRILEAEAKLQEFDAMNLNSVDEIYAQLKKWNVKSFPVITKWKSLTAIETVIRRGLSERAKQIDERFAGKPRGEKFEFYVDAQDWVGRGYKLVGNHELVEAGTIHRAKIVVRLLDPAAKTYVIETAYPDPR
jgi:hypothetical protein